MSSFLSMMVAVLNIGVNFDGTGSEPDFSGSSNEPKIQVYYDGRIDAGTYDKNFKIIFTINNNTRPSIKFRNPAQQALKTAEKSGDMKLPFSAGVQFTDAEVDSTRKILSVCYQNSGATAPVSEYGLKFSNGVDLDPEIKNGTHDFSVSVTPPKLPNC